MYSRSRLYTRVSDSRGLENGFFGEANNADDSLMCTRGGDEVRNAGNARIGALVKGMFDICCTRLLNRWKRELKSRVELNDE